MPPGDRSVAYFEAYERKESVLYKSDDVICFFSSRSTKWVIYQQFWPTRCGEPAFCRLRNWTNFRLRKASIPGGTITVFTVLSHFKPARCVAARKKHCLYIEVWLYFIDFKSKGFRLLKERFDARLPLEILDTLSQKKSR